MESMYKMWMKRTSGRSKRIDWFDSRIEGLAFYKSFSCYVQLFLNAKKFHQFWIWIMNFDLGVFTKFDNFGSTFFLDKYQGHKITDIKQTSFFFSWYDTYLYDDTWTPASKRKKLLKQKKKLKVQKCLILVYW